MSMEETKMKHPKLKLKDLGYYMAFSGKVWILSLRESSLFIETTLGKILL